VYNNATILRSTRIRVRYDKILRSGRKTYSLTEEESWLLTSRSEGANAPKQTILRNGYMQNKQAKSWKPCLRMSNYLTIL
jgi:hypothetical protein